MLLGAASLGRPGYSPDEEFTLFAVRGISAHGLPLLPSGLLYDRGLVYSYASWMAGALTGYELPAFRALSLASAAASLWLVFALVRRVAGDTAGLAAAAAVTLSLPFWAVATSGRFYAPFLASCLLCILLIQRFEEGRDSPRLRSGLVSPARRLSEEGRDFSPGRGLSKEGRDFSPARWLALAAAAMLCRFTHELAFTLLVLPLAAAAFSHLKPPASAKATAGRPARVEALRSALALAAGLALAQAALFAVHYLAPASGGTMIKRFFLWQVLNLIKFPIDPLDMFWHIWRTNPLTLATAIALMLARRLGAGGRWTLAEAAAHLGWVGWVLWFGVIDSGVTVNYLLLPLTFMLAAIAMDLVAIAEHAALSWPGRRTQLLRGALVGLALLVAGDQWRGEGWLSQRLAAARPTIEVPGIETLRDVLEPGDLVACTDELACLVLVGRVDAWLALDDFVRERFVVTKAGSNTPVGVYAGAPAVFNMADLFAPGAKGRVPSRVFVVDVFKEHPVGNSRNWLPRALAAEGIRAAAVLETEQARIVRLVVR